MTCQAKLALFVLVKWKNALHIANYVNWYTRYIIILSACRNGIGL